MGADGVVNGWWPVDGDNAVDVVEQDRGQGWLSLM